MRALLRGELIKATTTRTMLGYVVAGLALATANVLIVTQFSVLDTVSDKQDALAGLPILLLVLGLVGAAGEYRHRTAAPAALAARGGRGHVLLARAGAYAITGFVVAALMAGVSVAVGLPLLGREPGAGLGAAGLAAVVGGAPLAGMLSAIIGVAVGALVRNQVAGVIAVLILAFLGMELLANVTDTAVGYTPFGAAAVVAGDPGGGSLSWGAAAAVLVGWTVSLLLGATLGERHRDLA